MKLGNVIKIDSIDNSIGKTTFVRNIAGVLGEEGKKVLIIDLSEEEKDYIKFFNFEKAYDLNSVFEEEFALQTIKLIYPENRSITLIKNNEKTKLNEEFMNDFFTKIKKTYDYILIEDNKYNKNIDLYKKYINSNFYIIEETKVSFEKIKQYNKKNDYILINFFQKEKNQEKLTTIENILNNEELKFIGILEKIENNKILNKPSFKNPHTNFHIALRRITKRIIKNKTLKKIEEIEFNNDFSMEIMYKKFDIKIKNSF